MKIVNKKVLTNGTTVTLLRVSDGEWNVCTCKDHKGIYTYSPENAVKLFNDVIENESTQLVTSL